MLEALQTGIKGLSYSFPKLKGGGDKLSRIEDILQGSLSTETWQNCSVGVHPIMHASVPKLVVDFLQIKKEHGSPVERKLYAQMGTVEFITRLLTKRPLVFMTGSDNYLLKEGELRERRGHGGFDEIGTEAEYEPMLLKNLQSYDEMAISALLGMSVPTPFINEGGRRNRGVPGVCEPKGIYTGCAVDERS